MDKIQLNVKKTILIYGDPDHNKKIFRAVFRKRLRGTDAWNVWVKPW